jgi:hypothetical protein
MEVSGQLRALWESTHSIGGLIRCGRYAEEKTVLLDDRRIEL